MLKAVLFDMDGVIIDSEKIHKRAYFETFVSLGLNVSEELYKTLTGSSTINAFQKLKKMESRMRIDLRRNKFSSMGVFSEDK